MYTNPRTLNLCARASINMEHEHLSFPPPPDRRRVLAYRYIPAGYFPLEIGKTFFNLQFLELKKPHDGVDSSQPNSQRDTMSLPTSWTSAPCQPWRLDLAKGVCAYSEVPCSRLLRPNTTSNNLHTTNTTTYFLPSSSAPSRHP